MGRPGSPAPSSRRYALIDEGILHRPVAPSEVMRDQLMYLVEASERPNTIQVVPYSGGGHLGLFGAFVLAEMDDSPSIAYLEDASDGRVGEEPAMVTQVAVRFDALWSDVLPQGASRGLIKKVAAEHGRHSEAELAEVQPLVATAATAWRSLDTAA